MSDSIDAEAWGALLAMRKMPRHVGALPAAAIEAATLETMSPWGASRFGTFARCNREHALRYCDGVIPKDRLFDRLDYFELGTALHAILSYAWGGFQCGILRDWRDALAALTLRPSGIDEDVYLEAERLATAYFAKWGQPDWQGDTEIVAIEELIEDGRMCDACNGDGRDAYSAVHGLGANDATACDKCTGRGVLDGTFALPFTARLDLVLRIAGQIVLVDTKTRASKIPEDRVSYARDLTTREQFLGQCHLAMQRWNLEEPPGLLVNAIVKTRIPSFDRLLVRPSLSDVERWRENHAKVAARGVAGDLMNYQSCAPPLGSRCGYLKWCHGSNEERTRHYEVKGLKT